MKLAKIVCLSICFISGIAFSEVWTGDYVDVVISEIGATNKDTITDEDGDSPDWIELYNPTATVVNLEGWSLTNDRDHVEKWTFPAVNIEPDEFLLIFASGKDRFDPGFELHTNFKLSADGEYLALINPNGTIVDSYDPHFGPQYTDVSYGLGQTAYPTVVVEPNGPAKLLVPDSEIDSTWTGNEEPFPDSTWQKVRAGVGFGGRLVSNLGENVALGKPAIQSSTWGTTTFPAQLAVDGDQGNFSHTASDDYLPWWQVDLEGTFHIAQVVMHHRPNYGRREYNITVEILGQDLNDVVYRSEVFNPVEEGSTPPSNPESPFILDLSTEPTGGVYGRFVRISKAPINSAGGGDIVLTLAEVEVFSAEPQIETYTELIKSDIALEMKDQNASCYLRIPFEITDVSNIDYATLSLLYDDGFVAYLNGTRVAASNVPTSLTYNAQASGVHPAVIAEKFDIPANAFVEGTNILAIQGLNGTSDDIGFLLNPKLTTYTVETRSSVYFTTPTPGAMNGQGQLGFVDDTTFDIDRGFYDTPFDVTITSKTQGATIVYTLDGSEPSWTNGTAVAAPSPDAIPSATVHVSTTTVLRAAAFKDHYYPSNTDTHTYIFLDDVISSSVMNTSITQNPDYAPFMRQALTDLPTISIVDPSYRLGEKVRTGPYPEWTYDEYPISFEFISPDGSLSLQEDAGAGRYGGHWYDRSGMTYPWEKWSYRIAFRKEYGATTLKAPLFAGFDNGIPAVETFDQLEIRSGSHDMKQRGFYMSGALTTDTMLEMGNLNPHTRFVHVYINGVYWGQYNLHERWNAAMVAEYEDGEKEDYEAVKANNAWATTFEPYDGDGSVWSHALTLKDSYEDLKTWVDMKSFVDFMLLFLFGNSENEYRAVGSTSAEGTGFLFWLRDPDGYTRNSNRSTSDGPGGIFSSLLAEAHPDFMMFLADRIHEHLFNNGALTQAAMTKKLLQRCKEVEVAFYGEAARWGYLSPAEWASKRDSYINNVLANRTQTLLNGLINQGLYPDVVAPTFYINGTYQHGGMIDAGDEFSMAAPSGTIYYTFDGTDPRLPNGQVDPNALSSPSWGGLSGSTTERILIQKGAEWKYLDDGSNQGTTWRERTFNDSAWASGPAELGYGDGGESTSLSYGPDSKNKYITTYFRHTFHLTDDPSQVRSLSASLRRDDGAVVYLNGTEIFRSGMADGTVTYTTFATNTSSGSDETAYHLHAGIDTNLLVPGDNVIAVEVHQKSLTSSDISFDFELVITVEDRAEVDNSGENQPVITPFHQSIHVKSRVLDNGQWSALNQATFAVGDVVDSLRISELMYNPLDYNSEFIELKNIGSETINLNLVEFAKGVDFVFPNIDLAANEVVVVVQDTETFLAVYPGFNGVIAGEYAGSLDNDGERILLQDAIGTVICDFKFKDDWYDITDGGSFSLEVIEPYNVDPMRYGEKDTWRASSQPGGSPGTDDHGLHPGAIVINEVLANSEAWPRDWIELYNASDAAVNIGGWYLSDNDEDDVALMKYRIPDGTIIEAGDYLVFTENEDFGDAFALSRKGEKVCLSSAVDDVLTGYRETESFGASERGVTLGRHYKASTGTVNFVALSSPTFGTANAYPLVGPLVISEIMYHPPVGGDYNKDEYEYIELTNISDATVSLYDASLGLGWTFTSGIDYSFPPGTTIAPQDRLIIARNPAAFEHRYGFSTGVLGPFEKNTSLNNSGEQLQLAKPVDDEGLYIRIDRVSYSDGSHPNNGTDPWPTGPDGNGQSLTRKVLSDYGNDPANWEGQPPSP